MKPAELALIRKCLAWGVDLDKDLVRKLLAHVDALTEHATALQLALAQAAVTKAPVRGNGKNGHR